MSLANLLTYWFPNNGYNEFWFDKSKDMEILEKFIELFNNTKFPEDLKDLDNNIILSYIILFDQISRNIMRKDRSNLYIFDEYSLKLSNYILENGKDIEYELNKRIFVLLPLRHSRTTKNLDIVKNKLDMYKSTEVFSIKMQKLFNKFYMATLKDYSKVTDTIQLITESFDYPKYNEIIDDDKCNYSSYPINIINNDIHNNKLYKSVEKFVISNNIKRIVISLSGGVDSNVLMYILYQLMLNKKLNCVVAIHLNYGNREISDLEEDNLVRTCGYYNIPIITRRITHMKRSDDIDRMFYEEETKKIRFGLYKYAELVYKIDNVCLGHHKDDLSENVFMNILRGKDILDLFVMKEKSIINEVNILRPMLSHIKEDIYELAHINNITYFKDTTPEWSMRGTIRNKIYPVLHDFDKNITNNFHKIGKKSEEWKDIVDKQLIEPQLKKISDGRLGFIINFDNGFNGLTKTYWLKLLITVFHSRGFNMMTNKNIDSYINWIKLNNKNTLFSSSNGFILTQCDNKLLFLKKQITKSIIQENIIKYEKYINLNIGNWNISIMKTNNIQFNTKFKYDDLINGKIEYIEELNKSNILTISSSFNKEKSNKIKKLFKNFGNLNKYVPKIISLGQKKENSYITNLLQKYVPSRIFELLSNIFNLNKKTYVRVCIEYVCEN